MYCIWPGFCLSVRSERGHLSPICTQGLGPKCVYKHPAPGPLLPAPTLVPFRHLTPPPRCHSGTPILPHRSMQSSSSSLSVSPVPLSSPWFMQSSYLLPYCDSESLSFPIVPCCHLAPSLSVIPVPLFFPIVPCCHLTPSQ
jgi:hypothetical protein